MNPVEESGLADASALILVLKELDPLLDVDEVRLVSESLGEFEEGFRASVTQFHVLGQRAVLNILDAIVERSVGLDVSIGSENKLLATLVVDQFLSGERGPFTAFRIVLAGTVSAAHLLVDVDALVDVKADC